MINADITNIQYSVNEKSFEEELKQLKKKFKKIFLVRTSAIKKTEKLNPEKESYFVLYQDLKPDNFYPMVEVIIDKLIFYYHFNEIPFSFFSVLSRESYFNRIKNSDEIHNDSRLAEQKLFSENLIYLIESKRKPKVLKARQNKIQIDQMLDSLQLEAIQQTDGIVKVLAPAGSGKTKTLVNRIIHLINEGVEESRILALAFNKKAMQEMKNRLEDIGIFGVDVRTLHSLGYDIIRKKLDWKYSDKNLYKIQKHFLIDIFNRNNLEDVVLTNDRLLGLLNRISRAKLELRNYQKDVLFLDDTEIEFRVIFRDFIEKQKQHRLLTFDDMIYFSLCFLMIDSKLRDDYQNRYDYILVDEFQDLNLAQLSIIKIIGMKHRNIFAVGDDDQLIYGWCGARPEYILNFGSLNCEMKQVVLSKNYRSTKNIIEHSDRLIKNNKNRILKDIKSRVDAVPGEFSLVLFEDLNLQAEETAKWIQKNSFTDNWKDFAVLFRFNIFEVLLGPVLDRYNIPHTPINVSRVFKTIVGSVLFSYFQIVLNPFNASAASIHQALKKPNKYISRKTIRRINDWGDLENIIAAGGIPPYEQNNLSEFRDNVMDVHKFFKKYKITSESLIKRLDEEFSLTKLFSDPSAAFGDEASDNIIFEVILNFSLNFPSVQDFYKLMETAINEESESPPQKENENSNCVILSSIHRTKGNEYKNVVYYNLSRFDMNVEEQEDERRVTYVGITRAKENILITSSVNKPSNFLKEIFLNPELKKYNVNELQSMKVKRIRESKYKYNTGDVEEFDYKLDLELRYRELFTNLEEEETIL